MVVVRAVVDQRNRGCGLMERLYIWIRVCVTFIC
jgi:hypothetical protein